MAPASRDRILRVDLSSRSVTSEHVPTSWREQFLGGKGLGARYLYEELEPGTDPLGPANVLGFMLGPLSGQLPGESRYAAVTKSPLTGAFLDSYSGGSFPATLAGALPSHLGILVTGEASKPVKLIIEDGEALLEPAEDLWSADTVATCGSFPDAAVACTGPAGEQQVAYATIASDGGEHHAGRGGAGAVMGAKRLKAVVVRGDPPEPLPELAHLRERYREAAAEDGTARWQAASGTLESVDFANEVGMLSTRGWQEGRFEGAEDIGIDAVREAAAEREDGGDPFPGGFRVETDEGETVPRGATPMTLGAGLGVDDFDAVAALGETCDRLGLDVISAGNAVAWAIRARNADALAPDHSFADYTAGDLAFGDHEAAQALIEAVATRENELGDVLADGVDNAATHFEATDLVPTVKSMELPAYDPRGATAMALAYATSDRGGCHRRARPIEQEAIDGEDWGVSECVETVRRAQNARSILWSYVVDDFAGDVLWDSLGADWLAAVGHEYEPADLWTAGERIWTLVRLFNAREGFARSDDALPAPLQNPLPDGPQAGTAVDGEQFDRLLDTYYHARGWGPDGLPTAETLARLDLAGVADSATPRGDSWPDQYSIAHDD